MTTRGKHGCAAAAQWSEVLTHCLRPAAHRTWFSLILPPCAVTHCAFIHTSPSCLKWAPSVWKEYGTRQRAHGVWPFTSKTERARAPVRSCLLTCSIVVTACVCMSGPTEVGCGPPHYPPSAWCCQCDSHCPAPTGAGLKVTTGSEGLWEEKRLISDCSAFHALSSSACPWRAFQRRSSSEETALWVF